MTTLKFKKLNPEATIPKYMSDGASGMDLYSIEDRRLWAGGGGHAIVGTGLAVEIPPGFEGQIRPRSGLAAKRGITVLNSPGTIDSDYRGEVKVLLVNHSQIDQFVRKGERVAQLVIVPVTKVEIEEVIELNSTERGDGGLGSTGR